MFVKWLQQHTHHDLRYQDLLDDLQSGAETIDDVINDMRVNWACYEAWEAVRDAAEAYGATPQHKALIARELGE